MADPLAVRTVTVNAAVAPAFIEKALDPLGARTVSDAGALGSIVVDPDEPHAAHAMTKSPRESGRMRIRCAGAGRDARERASSS